MNTFENIWRTSSKSAKLAALAGIEQTGFKALLANAVRELDHDLAQLTMPLDQSYEALLQFQESYKDMRRERDTLAFLIECIDETSALIREAAE